MKKIMPLCFFSIFAMFADDSVLTPSNLTESEVSPMSQALPNSINPVFVDNQKNNNQILLKDNIQPYRRRKNSVNNNILPNNRDLVQDKIIYNEKINKEVSQEPCPPIVSTSTFVAPCARPRRLRCRPKCIVPRVICCPKAKPTICREQLPFCCQPPRVRCCKIRKICFPRPLRCCPQPIRCIPKAGICPIAKPKCPNGLPTPCATCYNPLQYSCSADSGSLIAPGEGVIPQRKNRDVVFSKPIERYREALEDISQEQDIEEQRDLTNQQGNDTTKEVTQQLA